MVPLPHRHDRDRERGRPADPPDRRGRGPRRGSVLVGAVAMEAFVLTDGNPTTPAILVVLLAIVAWHHRARTGTLLARALPTKG